MKKHDQFVARVRSVRNNSNTLVVTVDAKVVRRLGLKHGDVVRLSVEKLREKLVF